MCKFKIIYQSMYGMKLMFRMIGREKKKNVNYTMMLVIDYFEYIRLVELMTVFHN